jgi:hypothetical protein
MEGRWSQKQPITLLTKKGGHVNSAAWCFPPIAFCGVVVLLLRSCTLFWFCASVFANLDLPFSQLEVVSVI